MAITSIQMHVAFQKLFQAEEAPKKDVLQFGVNEADFDAVDQDSNEYLDIDEALKNNDISDLLYSNMVGTYGSRDADEAEKRSSASSGKNPFA